MGKPTEGEKRKYKEKELNEYRKKLSQNQLLQTIIHY